MPPGLVLEQCSVYTTPCCARGNMSALGFFPLLYHVFLYSTPLAFPLEIHFTPPPLLSAALLTSFPQALTSSRHAEVLDIRCYLPAHPSP